MTFTRLEIIFVVKSCVNLALDDVESFVMCMTLNSEIMRRILCMIQTRNADATRDE